MAQPYLERTPGGLFYFRRRLSVRAARSFGFAVLRVTLRTRERALAIERVMRMNLEFNELLVMPLAQAVLEVSSRVAGFLVPSDRVTRETIERFRAFEPIATRIVRRANDRFHDPEAYRTVQERCPDVKYYLDWARIDMVRYGIELEQGEDRAQADLERRFMESQVLLADRLGTEVQADLADAGDGEELDESPTQQEPVDGRRGDASWVNTPVVPFEPLSDGALSGNTLNHTRGQPGTVRTEVVEAYHALAGRSRGTIRQAQEPKAATSDQPRPIAVDTPPPGRPHLTQGDAFGVANSQAVSAATTFGEQQQIVADAGAKPDVDQVLNRAVFSGGLLVWVTRP